MKRLRIWINELSLTQQLLCIIFLFISVFAGFLLFFITPAIDRFSATEMYELLHGSQSNIIAYMNENSNEIPYLMSGNDSIIQVVYDGSDFLIIAEESIPNELKKQFLADIEKDPVGTQDYEYEVFSEKNNTHISYLYSITALRNNQYLISVITDTYRTAFRSSLVNGVVLMNVLVVSILLVLMMAWVGSLIYPLSQIKAYIKKIKNDEPAKLNINRNDEIGEVAEALTDMEKALSKQNREKEEMIQNISHDLKTPIATIKSYSEAIKDGIYPYETLEKSVDVIIEHADRLEKKVKSLIVLNKMGYLLDECPEGETLDMNGVIAKAFLSLQVIRPEIMFLEETDAGVKFHGDEEPWRIVVENLIDNALRYAKSYIKVTLHEGELCVINDGKQIDEDRIGTLFHPYEKGTDGQFGLGLSIVHKVCTTYGYHVQAENLPDGVCFRITQERRKNGKKRYHSNKKDGNKAD